MLAGFIGPWFSYQSVQNQHSFQLSMRLPFGVLHPEIQPGLFQDHRSILESVRPWLWQYPQQTYGAIKFLVWEPTLFTGVLHPEIWVALFQDHLSILESMMP